MNNPARWATDPTGRFRLRYWDGQQWTQHVSNGDGSTIVDSQPVTTAITNATSSNPTPHRGASAPQVASRGPQNSQAERRPRIELPARQQRGQSPTNSGAPVVSDARVLNVPSPGQLGEVHNVAARLRRSTALVVAHDPVTNQLRMVTERGEIRETNGRLRTAPVNANPLATRPGRIWWALNHFSHSFPPEAATELREQYTQLTASITDETIAFGLEALPHGLDDGELRRLGVEGWRISYERLRLSPGTARTNDRDIRSILNSQDCPASVRLALALNTSAPIDLALRAWPTLAVAFAAREQSTARDFGALSREAVSLAQTLSELGSDRGALITAALSGGGNVTTPGGQLLAALNGTSGGPVRVDRSVPLSLIDDVIDRGCSVELTDEWDDADRRYVVARQHPEQLTDNEVLELSFGEEALRRARSGQLATFGHLLNPDEQLSVAITALVESGRSLDAAALESLGDSPTAQELKTVIEAGEWTNLPLTLVENPGIGNLLVELAPPDREPRSPIEAGVMARSALRASQRSLFEWDWDSAVRQGQRGLALSDDEVVRDELMNVIAAALWMRGKQTEALHLLRKALEGQYTMPLVCNAAAVAATLDVPVALSELSRLAREAPDEVMRLVAAERAFVVWQNSVDDEDDPEPPAVLMAALRSLLTLNVSDDRYRHVLRILAEHDADWMAKQPPAAFGRRGASPEARVYRARAKGLSEFIAELASVHQVTPRPAWVEEEAVRLGSFLVGFLANNLGEDGAITGVSIAMDVLSTSLPLPAEVHIRLVALVSASVGDVIDEGEPKDEFLVWFKAARARTKELAGDEKDELIRILNAGGDRLAGSYFTFRHSQVNELIDIFNRFLEEADQFARTGQLNERAFKDAMKAVASDASSHLATIKKALAIVTDPELRVAGNELRDLASELVDRSKEMSR